MRLRSISNAVVSLTSAGSIVAASPTSHSHGHHHVDKRTTQVVTVVAYQLNGKVIDQSEVCAGINNGTFTWPDGSNIPPGCASGAELVSEPTLASSASTGATTAVTADVVSASGSGPTPSSTSLPEAVNVFVKEAVRASSVSTPTAPAIKTPVPTTPTVVANIPIQVEPAPSKSSKPVASNSASSSTGVDVDFPDGEIDCNTFPSGYGPIHIDWAGLGGWSGIQYVTIKGNKVTHIDTAVPGGDGCKPGAMCSYACPAGYQKSQWPPQQGSTGESVGGLACRPDGKLYLTNPRLSKKLCIKGTGAVIVHNKLSTNAAICRTDYPGTENEVVPLNTQPNSIYPLTCPDATNYFKHNGDSTSAQYYINNQGVPLHDACIWGADGTGMGNWAPSYLGVGQDVHGKTFLSISSTRQNNPSVYTPLNFTVKIVGETSGNCGLSNGRYCEGENYDRCNERGCTVELISGQATYVLADGLSL